MTVHFSSSWPASMAYYKRKGFRRGMRRGGKRSTGRSGTKRRRMPGMRSNMGGSTRMITDRTSLPYPRQAFAPYVVARDGAPGAPSFFDGDWWSSWPEALQPWATLLNTASGAARNFDFMSRGYGYGRKAASQALQSVANAGGWGGNAPASRGFLNTIGSFLTGASLVPLTWMASGRQMPIP